VKPSRFTYHAPTHLGEALDLVAEHGDEAKVLAGGQSLMPMLNFRIAAPAHLVDINRLPGLDAPVRCRSSWRVPALVRQRTIERSAVIADEVPLLGQALVHVAHPQIRNRGTVCGSLAHSDAAAELPTVARVLDATMHVVSRRGARDVPAAEFFQHHLTTALEPDELLLAVSFDMQGERTRSAFHELAARRGDFALAGVAAVVELAEGDPAESPVIRCRLAVSGAGPVPVRLTEIEEAVAGQTLSADVAAEAGRAAAAAVSPTGDVHASAAYRKRLVGTLVTRALEDVRQQWS
jgi:carbon-monoxide dehydrogenase medium subunit